MENIFSQFYYEKKWRCVGYKIQEATHMSTLKVNRIYNVYNSTWYPYNPLQYYSNMNNKDYLVISSPTRP